MSERVGAPAVARTVIAIWLPPATASKSISDKGDIGLWQNIWGCASDYARESHRALFSPSRGLK